VNLPSAAISISPLSVKPVRFHVPTRSGKRFWARRQELAALRSLGAEFDSLRVDTLDEV
jgi:hypothetical protein